MDNITTRREDALYPANTMTQAEAVARYKANVCEWLRVRGYAPTLSEPEQAAALVGWVRASRSDECATAIQVSREVSVITSDFFRRGK